MTKSKSGCDPAEIIRSLRLVREAMDRWSEAAGEAAIAFQRIRDALDDEDQDPTATWCTVRDVVAEADADAGWSHLRMRDDLVAALAGIEAPTPLTGPEDSAGLMEVPQMHDVVPGEDCGDN